MSLNSLFDRYQRLVLIDTETTGLEFSRDEIIELSAVVVEREGIVSKYDELVTLSPGGYVPDKIQQLTGITNIDLMERGLPKTRVCMDFARLIEGNCLLVAYNAHFDLSFLYYMLLRDGDPTVLKGKDKLDLLTVYRDRRPFPHRLNSAIEAYGLTGQVFNSHRAIDDVIATVAIMEKMVEERDDLLSYVNLFGYLPQYGLDGRPIGSVTYKPQDTSIRTPLYLR